MPGGHVDERHARRVRLVASDGTRPECTGICGALVGTIQQEVLPQDRPHFRGVRVDRRRLGLSTQGGRHRSGSAHRVCACWRGGVAVVVQVEAEQPPRSASKEFRRDCTRLGRIGGRGPITGADTQV